MKLYEAEAGSTYVVRDIMLEERLTRRLEALGVNERTRITLLNKKKSGTVIAKVRGTRLALGQKIASGIEIQEQTQEQTQTQSAGQREGCKS